MGARCVTVEPSKSLARRRLLVAGVRIAVAAGLSSPGRRGKTAAMSLNSATALVLSTLLVSACGGASGSTGSTGTPLAHAAGPGEPEPALPDELDFEAIDRYLEARVARGDFVGLSIAVMRGGKTVFAKGYGKASIEEDTNVAVDTKFAIASLSKQFTCATALLLEEDGTLQLSDAIEKHYPGLTGGSEIRMIDALQHTAGLRDYYPLDYVVPSMREPTDVHAVVETFAKQPLDFPPRTRWSYSNTGYLLVGRVIEKLASTTLGELMASRVFAPLEMNNTLMGTGPVPAGGARGYRSFALGDPEPAPREGRGWLHAAGGLWSTPSDLMQWNLALHGGTLLAPGSYETMTRPAVLSDGRQTTYACGLGKFLINHETVYRHTGSVNGYLSRNVFIPRTRSGYALMTNHSAGSLQPLGKGLLALLIKADQPDARPPKVTGPPAREVALELFRQLQAGAVERDALSADLNAYLTPERVASAAPRLRALGEPKTLEIDGQRERGGMEVTWFRAIFDSTSAWIYLYRRPDGIVEEFMIVPMR